MGFRTNKFHHTAFDAAEDLAYEPEGGRVKMWLMGVVAASVPIAYGIYCFHTGQATLVGQNSSMELNGPSAKALAIAIIAISGFMHFHWFWGLNRKLLPLSPLGKLFSAIIFIISIGYMACKILA
jgi:hypothetical protein